jgi:hypothetical protein
VYRQTVYNTFSESADNNQKELYNMAAQDMGLNDIMEVRISGDLDGQVCINTFHYEVTSVSAPGAQATMAQILPVLVTSLWDNGVNKGLSYITSTDYLNVTMVGQKVFPARFVPIFAVLAGTGGTIGGGTFSSGASGVIARKSIVASHKGRGRVFIPALPLTFVTASELNGVGLTAYSLASADWNQPKVIAGTGGTVTLTPIIFNLLAPTNRQPIAFTENNQQVRYQRRREVGRGI